MTEKLGFINVWGDSTHTQHTCAQATNSCISAWKTFFSNSFRSLASLACKAKSKELCAHETSAYARAMCVMRDKSKIEESDESHLSWAGRSENRVGEE